MKVLHVEAGRHLYGGARQVVWLAEGLVAHGVDSVVACPVGSALAGLAWPAGVRLAPLPMGGDLDIRLINRLRGLIRETRPDLVHLHSRRGADWAGALAARGAGLPVVLTRRVDNAEPRWLVPLKYRLYDRVIAISEAIARVLTAAGVPEEKLVTVHSAVADPGAGLPRREARRRMGVADTARVVGMAAQFIPRKGHDVLLDALPAVRAAHPDVEIVLFGQGPREADLRFRVNELGLADVVHFEGFREDLESLLPALDGFVHPATAEGLGVAVLEASRAGLPVVAAAAGGVPEIIMPGETGWLVPPGDAEALGQALVELLGDADEARRRGAAARERVRTDFSVDAMVAGNLAVYRGLVPEPGQSSAGPR